MPTLLDLVGIAPPPDVEAPSLVPTLRGQDPPRYVFTESGYQIDYTLSVRDGTWKLIYVPNELDRSLQEGTEYELYNLRTDPGELHNLYAHAPPEAARPCTRGRTPGSTMPTARNRRVRRSSTTRRCRNCARWATSTRRNRGYAKPARSNPPT